MKRLMFVAAIAAAMSGYSIESANVVGYLNKNTLADSAEFKFMVPTFNTVSGEAMKLKDIRLEYGDGTEENPGDPSSQWLWTFSTGGSTENQYFYVNSYWATLLECEEGWYTDDSWGTPAGNVDLPYGKGVSVCASDSTTKLVFAGSVKETAANVNTYADSALFYFTGNCMPTDYTLGDIALIYGDGTEENPGDPSSQWLWTFSTGGSTENQYFYVNEYWAPLLECSAGWYTSDSWDTPANDVPMAAGAGFAVCASEVIQVRVPSPLEK